MILFISIYLFISMLIVYKDKDLIKDTLDKHKVELNAMTKRQFIECMIWLMFILILVAIPLEIKLLFKRLL